MLAQWRLRICLQGQAKIADHLRKSYSLNDLSGDKDDQQSVHVKETDSENDDELGMFEFTSRIHNVCRRHVYVVFFCNYM